MKIKILQFADGAIATFDSRMVGEGPMAGVRVKHYIKREKHGYSHVAHWLEPATSTPIVIPGYVFISNRVFFGKYRAAEAIEYYQAETWKTIVAAIEELEKR